MRCFTTLTGRTRFRTSITGRMVLQVEETGTDYDHRGGGSYSPDYLTWRDAKVTDNIEPNPLPTFKAVE